MKIIEGNLIELASQGEFDVIVHGCNCFCTMSSGIAKSIREVFPEAYSIDLETVKGDRSKLGTVKAVSIKLENGKKLSVVNAYTQYEYGRNKMNVDYEALRRCFKIIKEKYSGKRIGYPMIGAGLAGGDWNIISSIIEEELKGENHTFVKFK